LLAEKNNLDQRFDFDRQLAVIGLMDFCVDVLATLEYTTS